MSEDVISPAPEAGGLNSNTPSEEITWTCTYCTFQNKSSATRCNICLKLPPRSGRIKVDAHASTAPVIPTNNLDRHETLEHEGVEESVTEDEEFETLEQPNINTNDSESKASSITANNPDPKMDWNNLSLNPNDQLEQLEHGNTDDSETEDEVLENPDDDDVRGTICVEKKLSQATNSDKGEVQTTAVKIPDTGEGRGSTSVNNHAQLSSSQDTDRDEGEVQKDGRRKNENEKQLECIDTNEESTKFVDARHNICDSTISNEFDVGNENSGKKQDANKRGNCRSKKAGIQDSGEDRKLVAQTIRQNLTRHTSPWVLFAAYSAVNSAQRRQSSASSETPARVNKVKPDTSTNCLPSTDEDTDGDTSDDMDEGGGHPDHHLHDAADSNQNTDVNAKILDDGMHLSESNQRCMHKRAQCSVCIMNYSMCVAASMFLKKKSELGTTLPPSSNNNPEQPTKTGASSGYATATKDLGTGGDAFHAGNIDDDHDDESEDESEDDDNSSTEGEIDVIGETRDGEELEECGEDSNVTEEDEEVAAATSSPCTADRQSQVDDTTPAMKPHPKRMTFEDLKKALISCELPAVPSELTEAPPGGQYTLSAVTRAQMPFEDLRDMFYGLKESLMTSTSFKLDRVTEKSSPDSTDSHSGHKSILESSTAELDSGSDDDNADSDDRMNIRKRKITRQPRVISRSHPVEKGKVGAEGKGNAHEGENKNAEACGSDEGHGGDEGEGEDEIGNKEESDSSSYGSTTDEEEWFCKCCKTWVPNSASECVKCNAKKGQSPAKAVNTPLQTWRCDDCDIWMLSSTKHCSICRSRSPIARKRKGRRASTNTSKRIRRSARSMSVKKSKRKRTLAFASSTHPKNRRKSSTASASKKSSSTKRRQCHTSNVLHCSRRNQ